MSESHGDLPDKCWMRIAWTFVVAATIGFLTGMFTSTETRFVSAAKDGLYVALPAGCICGIIAAWGKRCMAVVLDFVVSIFS